ncbi:MAG: glycoside hydrolase, partial [Flavobacterium sp.]|nr:glycoside hydrolase [Flavobacterium sp.]
MKYFIRLILYIFISNNFLLSQPQGSTRIPKQEVRAVWLATVAGLDWPRTTDVEEQKNSLLEIVQKLKDANYNTIFFQVRGRGDAFYKSNFEPWSDRLTGTLGKEPGWDPLEFILREAHARGMEVHAWFNTFRVRNGIKSTYGNNKHVSELHPDWVSTVDGETWLNPGLPEVREYLVSVAMDLVRNYDIDGIHFDFIRYPGWDYPDAATYKKYSMGMKKDDWRRENVNQFVRTIYDSAIAVKPMLKIGSAPIGVYKNIPNASGWQSYSAIYQDSRRWLQEKKHDYLAPQVYWSLGNQKSDPDFAALAKDWSENSFGRHVYIGIGAYKPEVYGQLPLLIDITRLYGCNGNSFFRYDFIKNDLGIGGRYIYPTNIPPMYWKDSIPPNPPIDLQISELATGFFKLQWKPPEPASDGDVAKYYNIYRSNVKPVNTDDPANIAAITTRNDTVFLDKIFR